MADITMCSGEGCVQKLSCYRHTATFNPNRQTIFKNPPIKDGKCEKFWDNELKSVFLQYDDNIQTISIKHNKIK